MKTRLIAAIIILSGISAFGWQVYQKVSVSTRGIERQRQNIPIAVEVAAVKKSPIREIGNFTGSLHPLSEFMIASKIGGRLEKLSVNIGDIVHNGQLVAVLDSDEYRQQVIQATAELEVARANLEEQRNAIENAQREYERTKALRLKKIASESQLDAAESEFKSQQAKLKVAGAQISQKEAVLKMAEIRLSYSVIKILGTSATGYVVGERFVDEGAMLAPNTPIVSILDIERLIVAINVIGRDYPKIQIGQEAVISTDAFPKDTFTGKVIRLAPILKEKSREARVEIEIPNTQRRLKPGMFARVQIQFNVHDNATVVPLAALVKRNGLQGVFVIDPQEQKAGFVPVTLGIINHVQAEVLTPVLTGAVVTLGQHLLEDGNSVILPDNKDQNQLQKGKPDNKETKPLKIEEKS
jgi:RND family efflux transporter MFP subunit